MSTGSLRLARRGVDALRSLASDTPDRAALLSWPGWGPLAPAFDPDPGQDWAGVADELHSLLDDDDAHRTARDCVDTSFYTPPSLVERVWGLVVDAGFSGGRVLEPGCGSGRFLAAVPAGLDCEMVGVEKDVTSARIASALYPDATVICADLAETTFPHGSFDLVIGNVPFSKVSVFDRSVDFASSLHTYFIARSLMAVRDGGYVAVVTARSTMDRDWFWALENNPLVRADFVGAVRLPSGTFRADGTQVVADVVLLQRNTSTPLTGLFPKELVRLPGPRHVSVSSYWGEHPDRVAGTMAAAAHHLADIEVTSENPDRDVDTAFASLREALLPYRGDDFALEVDNGTVDDRTEGSFHVDGDQVVQIEHGVAVARRGGPELRALIGLRDLAVALLAAESDLDMPDEQIEPLRRDTLSAWRRYVDRFGPLNRGTLHEGKVDPDTGMPVLSWRRPPLGGFRADPDYVTVMALEHYDQDTGLALPAAILTHRVNRRPVRVEQVDTPGEALAVSLGETGRVDLARIAELLHCTKQEAQAALGDLVFADPGRGGQLVPARRYLSGNIADRLAAATAAGPAFQRNVDALTAVAPVELGPLDITVALGSPFVATSDIEDFCKDVLGRRANVQHSAATGSWKVDTPYGVSSTTAMTEYGTPRMNGYLLIACALNGRSPVVYDEVYEHHQVRKVRNGAETIAAQEKLSAIQERFALWVWEDGDRSERICREYNRRFNSHVIARHDGSHLSLPGLAAGVALWPWQRDIIDQVVSSGATLCGHAVGAGKTLSMLGAVMTLREFGLASKPMIVVPNHLLEQIAREARQAFPTGRFLIAGSDDLAGPARRLFASRCATGDWDAVVITHSAFTRIPVSERTEREHALAARTDLEDHLRSGPASSSYGSKEIARRLRALDARIAEIRAQVGDEQTVVFEQLGVDFIAVDEAHLFKRLMVASRAEGFSFGSSKRATDLLVKMRWLERRAQGRPYAALFTGTPWTNTLAETFIWQTFLQPDVLRAAGVDQFDAWAAVFAKRETKVEVAPDGSGFRVATRPSALVNVAELRTMFAQNADILPPGSIPLPRPAHESVTVTVKPSAAQREYVRSLVVRADKVRSGGGNSRVDNMLAICGDGRRVALDPALVGVFGASPKVDAVAAEVGRLYAEHRSDQLDGSDVRGVLQVVFCDQGTPGPSGPQTYGRLRSAIVKAGVPASAVRFVHEATTDKSRAALFAACRDGSVAVLIGSTEKMGVGTNIQARLAAVHHADAPWRPSDIEQREGRALRPGNLCQQVRIVRYVTEGTFDAYMWQTLERKAGFIGQMFRHATDRSVEDIGDIVLDYAQVKALAAGSPLLAELATLSLDVKRLKALRSVGLGSARAARARATELAQTAELAQAKARDLRLVIAEADPGRDDAAVEYLSGRLFEDVRAGRPTRSARVKWKSCLHLGTHSYESDHPLSVDVQYDWSRVEQLPVKPGLVRRSRASAFSHLSDVLNGWFDTLADRAAAFEKVAVEAKQEAAAATAYADSYVFPHEAELSTKTARVAAIEAMIAEEAAAA